ncbi:MAG: hypothetical protein R3344_01940, partial [Acidobacteriota bacterium]|nr:hypothetical protein [Acidobacteriota bacterium]
MDFEGLVCPNSRPRLRPARVAAFFLGLFVLTLLAPSVAAQPCVVPDNGGGTVDLPPAGCPYLSPDEFHEIVDGLPPGTTIRIDPIHAQFFNVVTTPLPDGGEQENFDSFLTLEMTGQGPGLDTFIRTINMQVACEVVTGPRGTGSTQTFDTEMVSLQGQLFGDPDFAFLQIEGGGAFGLPSPGQTTLTNLPSGDWNVDSFFDISYRITFQGAPGSVLDGLSGTTTATVRMNGGEPAPPIPPCIVQDNGTGTVDLPPPGCGYVSPDDFHVILDGVPAGTTINIAPEHNRFFNTTTSPGGNLGGEVETFSSFVDFQMTGTGALAGFSRFISIPVTAETHTGPRNPGDSVQSFDTEMVQLDGAIFGDPDFD